MINKIKGLLKPIYVPLRNKLKFLKRLYETVKWLGLPFGKKCYIIGSPMYTNLGDSAILISQTLFLRFCGVKSERIKEISYPEYYEKRSLVKKLISKDAPLFGMGGGNMGNQWPAEERLREDLLKDFPRNPILIFPQTLHFVDDENSAAEKAKLIYNEHHSLTIVARETLSYEMMNRLFHRPTLLLSPDIVLFSKKTDYGVLPTERAGVLFVVRSDAEKSVDDTVWSRLEEKLKQIGLEHRRTDMYAARPVTKENRVEIVREKMQEFCGAELVITDRLHGMVFAAITGTPCIVFSNYNHKVRGTYEWIRYLPYIRYVKSVKEAESCLPELLSMKNCSFDNTPLLPYFEKLKEVVRSKCPR